MTSCCVGSWQGTSTQAPAKSLNVQSHSFPSFSLALRRSNLDTSRRLASKTFHLNCPVNMSSGILPSFLGALQASLAVLLTISYGVIASRTNILKSSSSRDISKMCVRLFLPALLITNVGKELHADTAIRYVPVLSRCNSVLLHSG